MAAAGRPAGARAPHRQLSVPALGRPEAARDDRDRARRRTRHRHRRRTDDGARRDDPEADPRPARRPAAQPWHGDAADHARPRHRRANGAARGADVRGPDHRGRGDEGVLRAAAASVRADAARRAARSRQAPRPAGGDSRHGAGARPALRPLSLCGALPAGARHLPCRAAGDAAADCGTPCPLRAVPRRCSDPAAGRDDRSGGSCGSRRLR